MRPVITVVLSLALLTSRLSAEPAASSPTTQSADAVNTGTATLLSITKHQEDRRIYFSFARGMRGAFDGSNRAGDIRFYANKLEARKHSADRSTIIDLGERSWQEIRSLPAATADDGYLVAAAPGHAYLVHVDDLYVDYWAIVRVTALEADDRCEIEWLRLNDPRRPGPAIAAVDVTRLAGLLKAQDDNIDAAALLQAAHVVLQVRSGAGGGNPNRVDMLGRTSIYVDHVSAEPISLAQPVNSHERAVAYVEGGRIPPGKCFVVEFVSYSGAAAGDSNGHGEMIVTVGREKLVSKRDQRGPLKGEWQGSIEVRPGEESKVFAEVANSSVVDVVIEGKLIDDPRLKAATQPATRQP